MPQWSPTKPTKDSGSHTGKSAWKPACWRAREAAHQCGAHHLRSVTVRACFPAQDHLKTRVTPAQWVQLGLSCPSDIWFLISDPTFMPLDVHSFPRNFCWVISGLRLTESSLCSGGMCFSRAVSISWKVGRWLPGGEGWMDLPKRRHRIWKTNGTFERWKI